MSNGGAGADTLIGGLGNDTYLVDNAGDVVVEGANAGLDTVEASMTYTLGNHVENLTLTGTTAISGTGNVLDNVLTGNGAGNTLIGGAGNDILTGSALATPASVPLGSLVIYARGTPVLGGYPTMQIYVDGSLIQEFTVDATNYTAYTVDPARLGMAAGRVDVVFGNDAYRPDLGQDRNLFVQQIVANGRSIKASDNGVLYDIGSGAAAFDGLNLRPGMEVIYSNGALRFGLGDNDTLTGGTGNDTYILGRGYAADTVIENDATAGNTDIAQFLSGVTADQIWFQHIGNNLEASIIGTGDKLVIKDWYLGNANHVEQFKTTDGARTLTDSNVQNLVDAMASFAPPAAGQTTLPTSYQDALAGVIAANWQ